MLTGPFSLSAVALPTLSIFFITFWVSIRILKNPAFACFIALVKAGVYFLYSTTFFNPTYGILDDLAYISGGLRALEENISLLDFGWFRSIASSQHFVYYLLNTVALYIFGAGYFAPVALNSIVAIFIAKLGAGFATQTLPVLKTQGKALYLFLLLYPNTFAWSTILNVKDIFILFLHVLLIIASNHLFQKRYVKAITIFVPSVLLCLALRFYVPILFSMALLSLWVWRHIRKNPRVLQIAGIGAIAVGILIGGQPIFSASGGYIQLSMFGPLEFLLTPRPYAIVSTQGFLVVPAMIHWLLLPPMILGIWRVWKMDTPVAHFLVIYFLVFVVFYGMVPQLRGPRQRIQLDYVLAIFQFIGLHACIFLCIRGEFPVLSRGSSPKADKNSRVKTWRQEAPHGR